jgi:hypothetical protein
VDYIGGHLWWTPSKNVFSKGVSSGVDSIGIKSVLMGCPAGIPPAFLPGEFSRVASGYPPRCPSGFLQGVSSRVASGISSEVFPLFIYFSKLY